MLDLTKYGGWNFIQKTEDLASQDRCTCIFKERLKKYFSLGTYRISLVVVLKDLDLGLN